MTRADFEIALRAFCRRRPFKTFVVELTSGDRFWVSHPEALAWRANLLYYRSPQDDHRLIDCGSVCQLLDASSIAAT